MSEILYTGLFIDHEELLTVLYDLNPSVAKLGRLGKVVPDNYIQVAYRPKEDFSKQFGKKVKLWITGYGRSDENEGLKAEIYPTDDEELNYILKDVSDPVIPISTSPKGLVKNTRALKFWPLFNSFFIDAVFAGVDSKGKRIEIDGGQ